KVRGFRIELGEVEAALREHPGVREAVVVVKEDRPGDQRLVAYVVPAPGLSVTKDQLRAHMRGRLPDFMLPSVFVILPALPRTPTGKVDGEALLRMEHPSPTGEDDFVPARNDLERRLARLWCELLRLNRVGVTDNFFSLGGHSLLALRMIDRVEKTFGKTIQLPALFEDATIEHVAQLLSDQPERGRVSASRPRFGPEQTGPFFCVPDIGGNIAHLALLGQHLRRRGYEVDPLRSPGLGANEAPMGTIEELAAYHLMHMRQVQPRGPYLIGGHSFGGIVAYELALQLQASGEEVGLLAMLDCGPALWGFRQPRPQSRWFFDTVVNARFFAEDWLRRRHEIRIAGLRARARMLRHRFLKRIGKAPEDPRLELFGDLWHIWELDAFPEEFRRFVETQFRAVLHYAPGLYDGRVTLFRARVQRPFALLPPDLGWRQLAIGGAEIHVVPGDHASILHEPHVAVLAEKLTACLAAHVSRMPE
ncbi:MAG TPA: thioesterase domain-containing protein, partial [Chloroflexota bacterium]|nr:thioesterase domain-containing protein [Chloroflexota bacterium]